MHHGAIISKLTDDSSSISADSLGAIHTADGESRISSVCNASGATSSRTTQTCRTINARSTSTSVPAAPTTAATQKCTISSTTSHKGGDHVSVYQAESLSHPCTRMGRIHGTFTVCQTISTQSDRGGPHVAVNQYSRGATTASRGSEASIGGVTSSRRTNNIGRQCAAGCRIVGEGRCAENSESACSRRRRCRLCKQKRERQVQCNVIRVSLEVHGIVLFGQK